jgi:hypothetical protein
LPDIEEELAEILARFAVELETEVQTEEEKGRAGTDEYGFT